jgi:hypothetical protein
MRITKLGKFLHYNFSLITKTGEGVLWLKDKYTLQFGSDDNKYLIFRDSLLELGNVIGDVLIRAGRKGKKLILAADEIVIKLRDDNTTRIKITKDEVFIYDLPDEDPHVKGQLWSKNGHLRISKGKKRYKSRWWWWCKKIC